MSSKINKEMVVMPLGEGNSSLEAKVDVFVRATLLPKNINVLQRML